MLGRICFYLSISAKAEVVSAKAELVSAKAAAAVFGKSRMFATSAKAENMLMCGINFRTKSFKLILS